ncbi:glycoside hydrolase family 36 protein [Nonomuraea sp. NPDC000554]|uniref:glycoside hydrolase family 36 protein n=1 Tax=Nonomuraea sp. NPDC000554 TaxID=3154259 RepID=UPI003330A261
MVTAGLAPTSMQPLFDGIRLAVLRNGAETPWDLSPERDGLRVLSLPPGGALEIRLAVPLGDAVGFWHPEGHWERTIVADWAGRFTSSLVGGAVAGCLFDSVGRTMLAFASVNQAAETHAVFGVSEENKDYVVHLHVVAGQEPYRLLFAESAPSVAVAMRRLRARLAVEVPPAPTPEAAHRVVYSTWYAFNQDVEAGPVEAEAALAAEIGCGVLLLDDGWQELGSGRGYAGIGDWRPDLRKFPDFAAHVARVRSLGLKYVAWVAPLLLGPDAECFAELAPYARKAAGAPGAFALDPRLPEVRAHIVRTCARLVAHYGLDGLKFDFLNEAMVYAGDVSDERVDVLDVGEAMRLLMAELRAALERIHPDVLIELRQPYTGPGMASFGNMLRADDCPADATDNRVRTIDVSLMATGGAVHSDMLMWDLAATPATAARQLLAVLHTVPQLSTRLTMLPESHLRMLRFWLDQHRRLYPILRDGELEPGRPDELYATVSATLDEDAVISMYGERVARVASHRRIFVVNASAVGRVVLDVTGAERTTELTVHCATGEVVEQRLLTLRPGLFSLPVPPSGLAVLQECA